MPEPYLDEAQDDATALAVRDLERAGVDIVTDGEMRRESLSNRFATALDGVDLDTPEWRSIARVTRTRCRGSSGRFAASCRSRSAMSSSCVRTDRRIKLTVPGPFTMSQQAQNDHYGDDGDARVRLCRRRQRGVHDLKAAGADVVQIDEPYMQARVENAARVRDPGDQPGAERVQVTTVLHTCFGYAYMVGTRPGVPATRSSRSSRLGRRSHLARSSPAGAGPLRAGEVGDKAIVLGVLDFGSEEIETVEAVADRIRQAPPSPVRSGWCWLPIAA